MARPGLLSAKPSVEERHIVNYLRYIGERCRHYRQSLPIETRGRLSFGKNVLSIYTGGAVSRARIERMEAGDPNVYWGIIASYFYEMEVFPDIVKVLESGRKPTLQVMLLIRDELQEELRISSKAASDRLNQRALDESKVGYSIK